MTHGHVAGYQLSVDASTRMEEKILGDDYKAVNALAKGRKN